MNVSAMHNAEEWESFLKAQEWSPFLQSYAMGEVYRSLGEEPVRLEIRENGKIVGICQSIVVPARRGKHLAILYGPVLQWINGSMDQSMLIFIEALKNIAKQEGCTFIRMSPFMPTGSSQHVISHSPFRPSPLHMLAEHIWYLDLAGKSEDDILAGMRKTTRNLIRRSEREGVTVFASDDPMRDLPIFFELYQETRKRHHFVPYSEEFIRAQVEQFSAKRECALYIARYNGEPVASSVHMIYGGETSYHHGASSVRYPKCFASYLLQWTAIKDALTRGDKIYNFWGISPEGAKKHPFAGVRTFKTGFGGELLELQHCVDLPLSPQYIKTWGIEMVRKWKRGF